MVTNELRRSPISATSNTTARHRRQLQLLANWRGLCDTRSRRNESDTISVIKRVNCYLRVAVNGKCEVRKSS